MVKSIVKEFIIILLMCIAIVLVLGIVFYGYIPNSAIPSKIAYETSESVKNELYYTTGGNETERTNIVYEITDSDLTKYKQDKNYNPGKADPFAEIGAYASNTIVNGTNSNGSGNNNGESNNTNSTTNKTGSSLFNDTSIK